MSSKPSIDESREGKRPTLNLPLTSPIEWDMLLAAQRCRHSQSEEYKQKQDYEQVRNKAGTALMLPCLSDRLDVRPLAYEMHSPAGNWMEVED